MAEKLKEFFREEVVRSIADDLCRAHSRLDRRRFLAECLDGLSALELTGRARHIAEVMREHLPGPFGAAARVLVRSLGPEHGGTEDFGMAPFRYLPHVFFVAKYGLSDFEPAMHLQYELTKRFTAEFSIRAFLDRYPDMTHQRLTTWAVDQNPHVRRLVSEGTRPRLPWAPRLRAFQRDPRPVLDLLELLKDDPVRYVQRSVANNLNDIGKDHPDVAVAVCRRWLADANPGRAWIVKHALRSLAKSGHREALKVLGVGTRPSVAIQRISFQPDRVRIGGTVDFSCELVSTSKRQQTLMIDYVVHYVKANGQSRPKVFKLRRLQVAPLGKVVLRGEVSLTDLTTRRHYPGRHKLELLVNGVAHPLKSFQVLAGPQEGGGVGARDIAVRRG